MRLESPICTNMETRLFRLAAIAIILVSPARPATPNAPEDAIDSLQALNSVVTSGVRYVDYAPRVLDARVKVDRFLDRNNSAGAKRLRSLMLIAISCYEAQSKLWNAKLFSGSDGTAHRAVVGLELSKNMRVLGACPAVRQTIYSITPSGESFADLIKLATDIEEHEDDLRVGLWQCAGEQLPLIKSELAASSSRVVERPRKVATSVPAH
jgi:hypothetical protein